MNANEYVIYDNIFTRIQNVLYIDEWYGHFVCEREHCLESCGVNICMPINILFGIVYSSTREIHRRYVTLRNPFINATIDVLPSGYEEKF